MMSLTSFRKRRIFPSLSLKFYLSILWFAIVGCCYFLIDKDLATLIHSVQNGPVREIMQSVNQLGYGLYYIICFSIFILASRFALSNQNGTRYAWFFLLSIIIPGLLCDILKPIFGRSRVSLFLEQGVYGFHWFRMNLDAFYYSFPSGHATTVSGLTTAGMLLWPHWRSFFILVLIAVCGSRVFVGNHFLSDILMGIYLGSIVTTKIHDFFVERSWLSANIYCRKIK